LENSNNVRAFHPSTQVLSRGTATVVEEGVPLRYVPAVLARNLYGQELVWGEFGFERRKNGTFKKWTGIANNANTENVVYKPESTYYEAIAENQPPEL
jgi:hypothetical protein